MKKNVIGQDNVEHRENTLDGEYKVKTHGGGDVFVMDKERIGNTNQYAYSGWSVNADIKIPFTKVTISAVLSGSTMDMRTWSYKNSLKTTVIVPQTTAEMYMESGFTINMQGINAMYGTGGGYDSLPQPLPDGTL